MNSWRPATGFQIALSDRTLAKIGFLAICDEQARQIALACLKSVKGLSADEWQMAHQRKFFEITRSLLGSTSDLDAELHKRVDRLEQKRLIAQNLRHQFVHSVWGHGPAENQQVSYDYKTLKISTQADIADAIDAMAHLTLLARRCLERTADLIVDGKLKGGTRGAPAMSMFWRDRWITF